MNLFRDMALSVARHGLTALAGYLFSLGIVDASGEAQVISAGLFLVGVAFSYWNKKGQAETGALLQRILDQSHHAVVNTAPSKFTPGDIARASLGAAVALMFLVTPISMDPYFNDVAHAQGLTGNVVKDTKKLVAKLSGKPASDPLDKFWNNLMAVSLDDLQYAKALADAAGTQGSGVRSKCWGAWITLIENQSGANATVEGTSASGQPNLFTKFERAAQVSDALQPNSAFMVACAPVASGLKLQVTSFVARVAAGTFGLSAIAATGGLVVP